MLPCDKTEPESFFHEIKILKTINDIQGVPKMIDYGCDNFGSKRSYFIVFEKLDRTLLDIIQSNGKLSPS